jgi:D-aminopeptidase
LSGYWYNDEAAEEFGMPAAAVLQWSVPDIHPSGDESLSRRYAGLLARESRHELAVMDRP